MIPSIRRAVDQHWLGPAAKFLDHFVRIPALSPHFDSDWERHRHLHDAVAAARGWATGLGLERFATRVHEPPGRSPALLLTADGGPGNVLFYGHLDKQPPTTGWDAGLGAWKPVRRGDRLFGRGTADDGYAVCTALGALRAVREQGRATPRVSVILECGEESGSSDLPLHLDTFADAIGSPDLIVALDSEAGDYERLWITTSLRGFVGGTLRIELLEQGVHSGMAGGIVASTFRVARQLLDRLEDASSGALLPAELGAEIPGNRVDEARTTAAILGPLVAGKFPWVDGARPVDGDAATLLLNNAWRGSLSVVGADGLPPLEAASNMQRPATTLALSVRLPPTVDAARAGASIARLLEADPPYGARVRFEVTAAASGWHSPSPPPWLERAVASAARDGFGRDPAFLGTGGTIPFVEMLTSRFPQAAWLVTGAAGPDSNAHGPNESLHLPTARHLTIALASLFASMVEDGLDS